ncbi:MAG: ComEA family DNA-binding protein [Anaerolineae bacterium]|nr:ComEA family DNA-binding protein [Anaerolineae bacterium]
MEWLERYRAVLFVVCVVAAMLGLALVEGRRSEPVPLVVTPFVSPAPTWAEPTPTPGPLRVYVSGAVQRPDVYTLPPGSIVKDALLAAGGAAAEADLDSINLAHPVADGEQVHIPRAGEQSPVRLPSAQSLTPAKVNVNTADLAELETLPGIGPELAQRILDYRQAHGPFARIEDLLNVTGIGSGILEKIRDEITTY